MMLLSDDKLNRYIEKCMGLPDFGVCWRNGIPDNCNIGQVLFDPIPRNENFWRPILKAKHRWDKRHA
jgi:hypothetical protein